MELNIKRTVFTCKNGHRTEHTYISIERANGVSARYCGECLAVILENMGAVLREVGEKE